MHSNEDPVQPKTEISKLKKKFLKFKVSNLVYHVGNQGLVTPFGQEGEIVMGRVSGALPVFYFLLWVVITRLYSFHDKSPSYTGLICILYITQKMFS